MAASERFLGPLLVHLMMQESKLSSWGLGLTYITTDMARTLLIDWWNNLTKKAEFLLCYLYPSHGSVNILSINRLNVYHPPYTTEFIWIRRELTARVDYELISVPSKLSLPQDTKNSRISPASSYF
ncbi:hypothetical protein TNCV_2323101 [Trichonephila clavipes]|nr:hypothetical protein TNCV_2323101 [Trichonephila clavipes]